MKTYVDIDTEISEKLKEIQQIKDGELKFESEKKKKLQIKRIKSRIEWLKVLRNLLFEYKDNLDFIATNRLSLVNQKLTIMSQFEEVKMKFNRSLTINEYKKQRSIPEIDKKLKSLNYICL